MPVLFARVELRGTPSEATYEKLHAHMNDLGWHQHLPGYPNHSMPHAMYQGSFNADPDIEKVAIALRSGIETNVWTKAIVLAIRHNGWSQSGG